MTRTPAGEAPFLLAIDSGLTLTKAVMFDARGREVSSASVGIVQSMPVPGHVERDMDEAWRATAQAIRRVLDLSALAPTDLGAVGVTGHGDGLYLVDDDLVALGPAILSLDSRAADILERWRSTDLSTRALELTGQQPMVAAPAPLLAWVKSQEPDRFARIRWILSCKDWLRLKLTGRVATDPTEASVSFTDVERQTYSREALALYGLDALWRCLPEITGCADPAGVVTAEAAVATGLPEGLPVVTGLHDVTAAALGLGMIEPGDLTMVAGTYSINETPSTSPARDQGFFCRNGLQPGQWMNMAISPASSANVDWFIRSFCAAELAKAKDRGVSVFSLLERELEDAFARQAPVVYHPFLFGSPHGDLASAAFLGMKAWHNRGDLLRALFEGVVFNHATHVDALRGRFALRRARLAGGAARNPRLVQLFADVLGLPIETFEAEEVSALGAAICAGVGCGVWRDPGTAVAEVVRIRGRHEPMPGESERLRQSYARYRDTIHALLPLWHRLTEPGGRDACGVPS
jgi:L-xylulokinase